MLRGVASSSSGITIGTTTITGGATTQVLFNLAGVVSSAAGFTYNGTSTVTIGTGTTSAVGVKIAPSTTSGYGGIFGLAETPGGVLNSGVQVRHDGSVIYIGGNTGGKVVFGGDGFIIGNITTAGIAFSVSEKLLFGRVAPTLASGGCTGAAMVANNGTATFTAGVGTSCSGSQPLVFTLPAATRGWNCYARNETNAASIVAAQSSAVSTTSVTITAYSRTLGTAVAWNDSDIVTVSCMGG